ncbi:hypothetical protein GXW82_30860 [Streptacidiphilus sp. 4-A2]|nr:hypothetical protein [Streptacidiphilus sp. 4-A2]
MPVALQNRDLDRGLEAGYRAVEVLARVESTRARGYIRNVTVALAPWEEEKPVADFVGHARRELLTVG